MATELETYRKNFLEEVRAWAAAGDFQHQKFVEKAVERLIDADELPSWEPCFYSGRGYRRRELTVDGFCLEESDLDSSVTLIVANYSGAEDMPSLTGTQVAALLTQAANFVDDAVAGRLHKELEPSRPESDLAMWLYENRGNLTSVRILLVSDAVLSQRLKELPEKVVQEIRCELHVFDIRRFQQLEASGGREPIEIDFEAYMDHGLPVLPASVGSTAYEAYLSAVPADVLASLYDRYGSRLLEGNVRAFLSANVGANKGIKRTIREEPERFFAYNNGITATATRVETGAWGGSTRIRKLTDLQIVNGGQTTASLFTARAKDDADLSRIFVQMKLSVVEPAIAEELIPKISRFANTQNKVSGADFFANHPLHRRLEEYSRQLWAPVASGSVHATKWFYERARGQYRNEDNKLKGAAKKAFLAQHPKSQVITKTDLAKFENTWARYPHWVSLGAQKNFVKYAERIEPHWDSRESDFNERWFRHVVGRAILFHATEGIVSAQSWYEGGYRANIVTYTLALLSEKIEEQAGLRLDFDDIWKRQGVPEELSREITTLAAKVFPVLTQPPASYTANVTEWSKREACWKAVRELAGPISAPLTKLLVDPLDDRAEQKAARSDHRRDTGIEKVVSVIKVTKEEWQRLLEWNELTAVLGASQRSLVVSAATRKQFIPTDAQATLLWKALETAREEGFR